MTIRFHRRDTLARRTRRLRARLAIAASMLSCTLACGNAAAQSAPPDVPLEYAVKATYLYKLAPFVNWPPDAFASRNSPFSICVVGDDPFDDFLAHAIAGHAFGSHPFVVRKLDALSGDTDCRVAFIGHLHAQNLQQALAAVQGHPVFTVTDSDIGADAGSIMQFVIDHGHVRFDIDNVAAARNHLSISSKLLNLAAVVKDNG